MLPFWPDQALLLYVCHEYEKSAREDQANREATSNVYWSIWDGSKQNWVVDGSDAKSIAGLTDIMPEKKDNNKKVWNISNYKREQKIKKFEKLRIMKSKEFWKAKKIYVILKI